LSIDVSRMFLGRRRQRRRRSTHRIFVLRIFLLTWLIAG
jgi:hypothetical protein